MSTKFDRATEPTEIEITPEMVEAGVQHLYKYHPERGVSDEDTVRAIFNSMASVLSHTPPVG